MLRPSRRVPPWRLFCLLLVVVALAGALAGRRTGATPGGDEGVPVAEALAPALTAAQRNAIERLRAIGYVSGLVPPYEDAGVVVHDRERAAPGSNLVLTGHAPEVLLMDMDGELLHRWSKGYREIWPGFEASPQHQKLIGYFRRAHLYPNGDVLVIVQGVGIAKLDRDSEVIWAADNRAHHDLAVTPDGDIYVITGRAHVVPGFGRQPILEDFVTVLDAHGREKRSISILKALLRGDGSRALLAELRLGLKPIPFGGDILHTNTLTLLKGRAQHVNDAFRRGRVLTSMRSLNALAVIDLDEERAVWSHQGDYRMQHDPKIVDGGNLLLFDNQTQPPSRILEMDLGTSEIVWSFEGSPERPFFTPYSGAVQRLPNGNTLVTESMPGRVFELTRSGEVVWEFRNPNRAGANGELVAQIPELVRLDPDFPLDWTRVATTNDGGVAPGRVRDAPGGGADAAEREDS